MEEASSKDGDDGPKANLSKTRILKIKNPSFGHKVHDAPTDAFSAISLTTQAGSLLMVPATFSRVPTDDRRCSLSRVQLLAHRKSRDGPSGQYKIRHKSHFQLILKLLFSGQKCAKANSLSRRIIDKSKTIY